MKFMVKMLVTLGILWFLFYTGLAQVLLISMAVTGTIMMGLF